MAFWHASKGDHGFRFWWHVGRSIFSVEMAFLRSYCHAEIRTSDKWTLALAVPGIAIWIGFEGFGLWHPKEKCKGGEWNHYAEFYIPDQRKCAVSVSDWTLRIVPWGRSMSWSRSDPWWITGFRLDFADLVLGRRMCSVETLKEGIPIQIPLPEGTYAATAKIVKRTWKRSRWFSFSRTSTEVDIPKGLPFAGKGENSWDCGDDGLFGYGVDGTSLEHAIAHGVESVLKSRRKYGHASPNAIKEALSV